MYRIHCSAAFSWLPPGCIIQLMLHSLQPSHGAVNFILAQLYTVVNTQHRILVGSRPAGLSGSEGAWHGFRRCDIVRMTPEDVLRFLKRWYALDQSCTPQQQQADADALYARLQATPGLLELVRTPLLCTILLLIWRNEQELPGRRVEIYKKCCQTLLTSWERHHGVQARGPLAMLGWEQQFHLLALLAYTIHCRGQQTTASRKDLLDELKKSILAAGFFTQEQEAAHAAEHFLD